MSNMRFAGKYAVVTGAAQGIGRAVALRMAEEGCNLTLFDRSDLVQKTYYECSVKGVKADAVIADLERFDECHRAMKRAHEMGGRIDILINNVGGTIWVKPFEHYTEEQTVAEINRSLFPTLWCCHAVLPYMIAQQQGAIVNVSSVATRSLYRVPYAAAKGGVNAITACLAFENAERGIRVNGVAPGGTDVKDRFVPRNASPKSPEETSWYNGIVDQTINSTLLKRYGTPDEQAAAILFLASDDASYITGITIPVAGGDQG